MSIFEEIESLGFPSDEYVVVGSASLAVRGIREARDIDIVVVPELYDACEKERWDKQWHNTGQRYVLHKQGREMEIEVYLDVNCEGYQPTTAELIDRADSIRGIPFVSLQDLLALKKGYGRPKDLPDIQFIENAIHKSSSE